MEKNEVRNHRRWAEWFYYNHDEEMNEILYARYGIEFNMSKKDKIKLYNEILSKHWTAIHKMTFKMHCQLFWSKIKDRKREVVLSFKVFPKNYFERLKFRKKWKNGKK